MDSNSAGCWNRLGKAYLELSKYKDARVSLERALAIDLHNRVVTRQLERLSNLNSN
ncbi:MAG: tetratricopeptide repeat protein [Chloroflexi bacterium]|nr:tetratricopeptide repeat protein [Chloroflexota bacterium]MBT7468403.1 tetratricopeptide repeat protein [Chloroflexota bacterium]